MQHISKLIHFYHDCYQADNRELSISNVLTLGKDCHWIDSETELLACGDYPRFPIDANTWGLFNKKSEIYLREKTLIYCVGFIAGTTTKNTYLSKQRTLCSPLFFYEASLEYDDGNHYIAIDLTTKQLNNTLLTILLKSDDEPTIQLDNKKNTINETTLTKLLKWLDNASIVNEAIDLVIYPKLNSKSFIKNKIDNSVGLSAISAAALILADRPKGSRGILHELDLIASENQFSNSLSCLLTQHKKDYRHKPHKPNTNAIPSLLSSAQKKALSIAANNTLGFISGPPGTGKSYTIAAIALERLIHGESVLIVSETEQALSVIQKKLQHEFKVGDSIIRAGEKEFLQHLKKRLDNWLNTGIENEYITVKKPSKKQLNKIIRKLNKHEKAFIQRAKQSVSWGLKLSSANNSFLKRLINRYISYRISISNYHWHMIKKIHQLIQQKETEAAKFIKHTINNQLLNLLAYRRQELSYFNQAIRARTSSKQQNLFANIDYHVLLTALPIWLVSLSSLHKVIPLTKELFDLVIIDEATQCNIASTIPAIQRGKRLLVVGDSKQLRHVSFLSHHKEQILFNKQHLDQFNIGYYLYRDHSILDLVSGSLTSQRSCVMLNEHFRSQPDIIAFSNQYFYKNKLTLMKFDPLDGNNVIVNHINGKRNKRGINQAEGQAALVIVNKLIAQYNNQQNKPSIGIISPYREQTEYLQKKIIKTLSLDHIQQYKIRAATPYGFQGDERDIVIISFTIDNNSLRAASYLNREDMFNVAITRARQKQFILLSIETNNLNPNHQLRRYLSFIENKNKNISNNNIYEKSVNEVCDELNHRKINTWQHYPVAGINADILCECNGKTLAIDLIGFPDKFSDFLHFDTYKLFHRANLPIFPLSYGLWQLKRQDCLNNIVSLLG